MKTFAFVMLLAVVSSCPARAAEPDGPLQPMSLQVGFTKFAFSNVNRNDAEAAFKVFVQTIAKQRGYAIISTTRVFEDASDFEPAIKAGKIDLVIIDSWRLLGMDIRGVVTPHFVTCEKGRVGKRYVVLTQRGSKLDKLEDLRGKEIAEIEVTNANLGRSWLETHLLATGLGTHKTFFSRVENVHKTSAAVLPVFFGKKPACLVDEPGFKLMTELNPQVGAKLQVVAVSERLLDGLICLRNSGWPSEQQKRDVISALAELHTNPAGQQILTLFKIGLLAPFQETHLDTARELHATHDRLSRAGQTGGVKP